MLYRYPENEEELERFKAGEKRLSELIDKHEVAMENLSPTRIRDFSDEVIITLLNDIPLVMHTRIVIELLEKKGVPSKKAEILGMKLTRAIRNTYQPLPED